MVELRSIWLWWLQLQEEKGTGAALQPRGDSPSAAKNPPLSYLLDWEVVKQVGEFAGVGFLF